MRSELKFIGDENFDKEIVLALREVYDVTYVAEFMAGADERTFLENAEKEQRIVLTSDKDSGDLVFRKSKAHAGVTKVDKRVIGYTDNKRNERNGGPIPSADKENCAVRTSSFLAETRKPLS